jgi:polyhydroxyalkanoate synthesis regulator phasin
MEDNFKKLLYAGVGIAVTAKEKFEKAVDDLVNKGKVNESEGKKMVDDFVAKTEEKKNEFDKLLKDLVEKVGYSKKSEVEELRKRIEELEAKAGKAKTATK